MNAKKTGRNDPCPCGSGKKYKSCCDNKTNNSAKGTNNDPSWVSMAFQFATSHHNSGRLLEAEAIYQKILQVEPDCADAMHLLGLSCFQRGMIDSAEKFISKAINASPSDANYHNNLGLVCRARGNVDKAIECFRHALRIDSNLAEAHSNLGNALRSRGMLVEAINCYIRALKISDIDDARFGFAQSVIATSHTGDGSDFQMFMTRAISEGWASPEDLLRPALSTVLHDPIIRKIVGIATQEWPKRLSGKELFGSDGLAHIEKNALLHGVMKSTPIANAEMERFLTKVRSVMLDIALKTESACDPFDEGNNRNPSRFFFALAHQCFINEYAFYCTEEEQSQFKELCEKIAHNVIADIRIPDAWLAAAAAYAPLASIPNSERLLELAHSDAVSALLNQQVREVLQEASLRKQIPRLTEIGGETSVLVKAQYEENPYPRWVTLGLTSPATTLDTYFRQQLPYTTSQRIANRRELDVLVAGCGTGRHAISTALSFQGAKVVAVDLSLASLGYAKRKTLELGLTNLDYFQADILKLGNNGLGFDLIECAGVLHHLADPVEGLLVLEKLLRPGGVMCLGLYSELAREDIVAARQHISEKNYGAHASDIREFRHALISQGESVHSNSILSLSDFYSLSGCRDLLFHVQEHRYTLPKIKEMLKTFGLTFILFDVSPVISSKYQEQYPDDPNGVDLDNWHRFETKNPNTFSGMYQFWVQKPTSN